MKDLIVISSRTFSGIPTPAINAKDLYSFLSKSQSTRFNDWITRRIEDYGFVCGEDYLTQQVKTSGRPRTDYYLTIGMAKEISMVERSEKGREVRRYFIECEKELNARRPSGSQEALPANVTQEQLLLQITTDKESDLPKEIKQTLEYVAMKMTLETKGIVEEYLLRLVSYECVNGYGKLNEAKAIKTIKSATIERALLYKKMSLLETYKLFAQMVRDSGQKIFDEVNQYN